MTREDIEKAITQLSPTEFARLREWFDHFEAERFDATWENDARTGRLNALGEEALIEHLAGQTHDFR